MVGDVSQAQCLSENSVIRIRGVRLISRKLAVLTLQTDFLAFLYPWLISDPQNILCLSFRILRPNLRQILFLEIDFFGVNFCIINRNCER